MISSLKGINVQGWRFLSFLLKISAIFMEIIDLKIDSGLKSDQQELYGFGNSKQKCKGQL